MAHEIIVEMYAVGSTSESSIVLKTDLHVVARCHYLYIVIVVHPNQMYIQCKTACSAVLQPIVYEGQDKNPEMCRVLLTHEVMCR